MTAVPGNLDWQSQTAQTLRLIDTGHVVANPTDTQDITALVGPNAQGLVFFWVAALASVGQGITLQVVAQPDDVTFNTLAAIPDGGTLTVPFYGSIFRQGTGATAAVNVSTLTGDPTPLTGTLYTFEATGPVTVIPTIRRDVIGRGVASGPLNIGAAATGTLIAAPPSGSYYRLKMVTIRSSAALAAVAPAQVQQLTSGTAFAQVEFTTATGQTFILPFDLQMDDGVKIQNQTSVTIVATAAYEIWRA
jgi:hypothetical protein